MKILAVVALAIGVVLFIIGCGALSAWILMLLLGALASLTGWETAINFWASLIIVAILGMFVGGGRSKS